MALTAAQTISVYQACGLHAGGTTRYRYRFNAWSSASILDASISWSYADIKTALDTRLAAMSDADNTWIGTHITTWDNTLTSSFSKTAGPDGVLLDDAREHSLAQAAITKLVGIEVEPVSFVSDLNGGGGMGGGRVTR